MLYCATPPRRPPRALIPHALAAALLVFSGTGAVEDARPATPHTINEPFSATTHMDASATTALWDTVAGVLTWPTAATRLDDLSVTTYSTDIAVEGHHAYLAAGAGGLQVYDTSDPTTPALLGSHGGGTSPIRKVAVDADLAVVAYTQRGDPKGYYRILDVSDPSLISTLDSGSTAAVIQEIVLEGDLCILAAGSGLYILDLTNPSSVVAQYYGTTGSALDVELDGRRANVAASGYVEYLTVFQPGGPGGPPAFDLAGARRVASSGSVVYVATDTHIHALSYASSSTPTSIASVEINSVQDMAVSGNWLYVASNDLGLRIYDVSHVSEIQPRNVLYPGGNVTACAVTGNLVHVATTSGMAIYRVASALDPPEHVSEFAIPDDATAVAVRGDYAAVATYGASGADQGNLVLLDIHDPTAPLVIHDYDGFPVHQQVVDLVWDHDHVFALTDYEDPTYGNHSAVLYSIFVGTAPYSAVEVDAVAFSANAEARTLVRQGKYLYAGCRTSGVSWSIVVIDTNDVANLAIAGHGTTLDRDIYDLEVFGDHLFVAEPTAPSNERLQVLDISDPTSPTAVWNGYLTYNINDVDMIGHVLSTIGLSNYCFDISDPSNPVYDGLTSAPNVDFRSQAPAGRYMAMDTNTGFGLVDFNDPAAPALMARTGHVGNIRDLAVSGELVYGAANRFYSGSYSGLHAFRIFDHSYDPGANRGQSLTLDSSPLDIYVGRILAGQDADEADFYLTADGGLHWEAVTPGQQWHEFVYPGSDLRWRADLHVAPDGRAPEIDLIAIQWFHTDVTGAPPSPARFDLLGASPNPFNPWTTISFTVPEGGGNVSLDIYNLRGQLVRTLGTSRHAPGLRTMRWDGTDDQGRRLAGGTYICRMRATDYEGSTKVTLVP